MSPAATFSQAITPQGPILAVGIALPDAVEQALRTAGRPVPAFIPGTAIVDTGATVTVVALDTVQRLGLSPLSSVEIKIANGQVIVCGRYLIKVVLPAPLPPVTILAVAMPGLRANDLYLLGRDVLSKGTFCLYGEDNLFTLTL